MTFILSVLGCFSCELIAARIESAFCKFELECSIAGIFKLETVFAKKSLFKLDAVFAKQLLKGEKISSSLDMTFPFSIRLIFLTFDTFCVKWDKMDFQDVLLLVIFLVLRMSKYDFLRSSLQKYLG